MGQFDSIVLEFLERPVSAVPIISDDEFFCKSLRAVFKKALGIKREVMQVFPKPSAALKYLNQRMEREQPTLLFCEGAIQGRQTTSFIASMKVTHPDLMIIALVFATRREDIAYLYEVGANNVIAKPASANNILEKMAFTIKPHGKLTLLVRAAKEFLRSGEHAKVLKVCKKILTLKPGSPTALMLIGDACMSMGDRDRALAAYEQAHANAGVFIEPLKRLISFYEGVDADEHLKYLEKLDKLSPLHADRKKDIGVVHLGKGNQPVAELYFDKAMKCVEREAQDFVVNMAESIASVVQKHSPYLTEKYLAQALDAKEGNLSRDDLGTFNRLGIALKAQGKWQEAIECYRKALKIVPTDEGLHYNMGLAFFEGGRVNEAVASFSNALRFNPELNHGNVVVSINLANVFYEAHEYKRSLQFAEHVLEIDAGNANASQLCERLKTRLK